MAKSELQSAIPVIDFQHLVAGGSVRANAVAALGRAAAEWGFFQLVGDGVPDKHRQRLFKLQRAFFDLPLEQKLTVQRSADNARGYNPGELTKNRRDAKEIFDFGHQPDRDAAADAPVNRVLDGWNQFPADLPWFRDAAWRWYGYCETLACMLLDALGEALAIDPHAIDAATRPMHSAFLRLNHYPPQADPAPADAPDLPSGSLGIHHHTDAGLLTLLVQEGDPGLQVRHGGRWHLIEPLDDAFIVNIGDMMQVLANDACVAPEHRVLATAPNGSRQSAAFFLNPGYDAEIAPRTAGVPRYRAFTWGEYRGQRAAGDYADLGAEVQLGNYRLHSDADTSAIAPETRP